MVLNCSHTGHSDQFTWNVLLYWTWYTYSSLNNTHNLNKHVILSCVQLFKPLSSFSLFLFNFSIAPIPITIRTYYNFIIVMGSNTSNLQLKFYFLNVTLHGQPLCPLRHSMRAPFKVINYLHIKRRKVFEVR